MTGMRMVSIALGLAAIMLAAASTAGLIAATSAQASDETAYTEHDASSHGDRIHNWNQSKITSENRNSNDANDSSDEFTTRNGNRNRP